MAKKVEQQTRDIREEAKQEVQKELKVEGITPERKKKILGEWKEINIKLKEIELRNKKKEGYKHTFKRLEEFKQLNGKTIYSDAMGDAAQRDKDSMSLEMAYSQVDPMYRVVLEDMAKYIRPGVEKELLNKCKLDRGLIRDLTGIINVLKFIEIKDYSRAKTAFLYFQLGENRIKDIEQYFNVNLGSLFKDDIKQVYDTARELGISEKELAMNASTKMSSYSSQAEDMERSVTGKNYTAEIVISSENREIKRETTRAQKAEIRQAKIDAFLRDKETKSIIPRAFSETIKSVKSIKLSAPAMEYFSKPEHDGEMERMEALTTMARFTKRIIKAEERLSTIISKRNTTELAATLYCMSENSQIEVVRLLTERDALEHELEGLAGSANEERVHEIEARMSEINEEMKAIISGKHRTKNNIPQSEHVKKLSKLISIAIRELDRLKDSLESTADPEKREEIKVLIQKKKEELAGLKERMTPAVVYGNFYIEGKSAGIEIAAQTLNNTMEDDSVLMSSEEIDAQAAQFNRVVRKAKLTKAEADKLIEDAGFGIDDPEILDKLQYISTSYSSEYISQVQNEKSLPYLLSQINNPDKHKRENSIGAILNYINERVNVRRNMLTNESIAELEDALNQVKSSAGNVTMGKLSVAELEKALKEARQNLSNKEKALQESDSKFATLPTDKAAEDYAKFIQKFYTTVSALPKAYEVNYTLEEVDKLQAQFDMCESMIAEKGVVGDDGFNNQRKAAREKIENIRYRTKMNPILDTTGVIKLKTREERVALMRENLKYLVGLIKNSDGCQLRAEDNAQIKELLIEYRKLRVLNWDLENGEKLEDIDEMIRVIDDWSMETDLSKSKTQERIETLRTTLNEVMELVAAGDFGPATVKKWADAKKFYNNLKNQQKVNRRILIEFDENYAKIEQTFKEKAGPSIQVQLVSIRDGLKESLMTKKFYKIDIFKLRYEKIKTLDIPGLDSGVVSEIDELLKTAQKERTARSDRGASLLEQIIDVGQEIKTMRNKVIDKGFESFDEAKFNACVLDFEYLKELLLKEPKSVDKSIIANVETTIEGFKQEISNHKAGKSREKLTESDYEALFAEAETEPENDAQKGNQPGDKKGKFTVAGPVESEGASREIEESPIPEPEGMGASKELEGKGISAQEIENMQKK